MPDGTLTTRDTIKKLLGPSKRTTKKPARKPAAKKPVAKKTAKKKPARKTAKKK